MAQPEVITPFKVDSTTIQLGYVIDLRPGRESMVFTPIARGQNGDGWYISTEWLRSMIVGECLDLLLPEQSPKSSQEVRQALEKYQVQHPDSKSVLGAAAYTSGWQGHKLQFNNHTIGVWEKIEPGDAIEMMTAKNGRIHQLVKAKNGFIL